MKSQEHELIRELELATKHLSHASSALCRGRQVLSVIDEVYESLLYPIEVVLELEHRIGKIRKQIQSRMIE